ncbi:MAG: RIP metalloprotease [Actinomycetes bacterium]|jgi:regulator of sigma E protease|nr:RIP metalloprotease [Actinomycetes bacterium]
MPGVIPSIFWGIVTLSIVVFFHEGGHFVAARLCGLEVSEFMLGLPGPKISWKWGRTRYGVTAIPFGGYCRIPALEGQGAAGELGSMTDEERARYVAVPAWKRVVVLASGIIVNLVLAVVIFTCVLSIWGSPVDRGFFDAAQGGPLAAAGFESGSRITAIDGDKVASFEDLSAIITRHQAGDVVRVTCVPLSAVGDADEYYAADGRALNAAQAVTLDVTLGTFPATSSDGGTGDSSGTGSAKADPTRAYLGVTAHVVDTPLPLLQAFGMAMRYVWLTLQAIFNLLRPSTFAATVNQSTSVVGISVIAAQAAQTDMLTYAQLIAAISLSLGLMNALPIPPLDGGKILIELIQAAIRRPLKQNFVVAVSLAGFALMICFMVFVVYKDVARLLG